MRITASNEAEKGKARDAITRKEDLENSEECLESLKQEKANLNFAFTRAKK